MVTRMNRALVFWVAAAAYCVISEHTTNATADRLANQPEAAGEPLRLEPEAKIIGPQISLPATNSLRV